MNHPRTQKKHLNQASLSHLSNAVWVPQYDRNLLKNGIAHIGVGGWNPLHQALYLDDYFQQTSDFSWRICGVGLLEQDHRMRDALRSQDCLYTLVEKSPNADRARIIGSIDRYLFAPENPQAVIAALAAPDCRIVTLTITEGGYYYSESNGELELEHPTIQHDLKHPDQPFWEETGVIMTKVDLKRLMLPIAAWMLAIQEHVIETGQPFHANDKPDAIVMAQAGAAFSQIIAIADVSR